MSDPRWPSSPSSPFTGSSPSSPFGSQQPGAFGNNTPQGWNASQPSNAPFGQPSPGAFNPNAFGQPPMPVYVAPRSGGAGIFIAIAVMITFIGGITAFFVLKTTHDATEGARAMQRSIEQSVKQQTQPVQPAIPTPLDPETERVRARLEAEAQAAAAQAHAAAEASRLAAESARRAASMSSDAGAAQASPTRRCRRCPPSNDDSVLTQ